MCRYNDVDDNVVAVFLEVAESDFPEVSQLKIKLMFDTKKRITKGKFVLASTEVVNEKIKFLTATDLEVGYDYLIIINRVAWECAEEDDKKRLLRHELRHIFVNENDKCTILPHDVEDFAIEIEKNKDKPLWAENLIVAAVASYDEMKG